MSETNCTNHRLLLITILISCRTFIFSQSSCKYLVLFMTTDNLFLIDQIWKGWKENVCHFVVHYQILLCS